MNRLNLNDFARRGALDAINSAWMGGESRIRQLRDNGRSWFEIENDAADCIGDEARLFIVMDALAVFRQIGF